MSDRISLTLSYKGSISKALYTYIKKVKEDNKEDLGRIETLDTILKIVLLNSTRGRASMFPFLKP